MQRVMITGGPGSGKSTLARIVSKRTGLPVHHMDQIHWKPGWEERASDEKVPMVRAIIAGEKWVFEGGNSRTYHERAARSDTFIWLDLPVSLRFHRVVCRTIRDRGTTRPDMADGCRDGFHSGTLPFWRWIWKTRRQNRLRIARLIDDHPHLSVHHLKSRSQVAAFIARLSAEEGSTP